MRRFVPVLTLSLILLSAAPVAASPSQAVLGTSTNVTEVQFPAVTSGPGHILSDSPLYAFDKLYQKIRLLLVFTPENRARLHAQIAGERLAELRVATSRNNQIGIDNALTELSHESMAAASDLRDAATQGKDVTQLARDIHQQLTDYREVLKNAGEQVPDSAYEQKLVTASDVLWEAKLVSEDALPAGEADHQLAANIEAEVNEAVLGVASSAVKLEKKLSIYEKFASKAAEAKAKRDEAEASRSALQEKRNEILAQRKKAIQEYLAKVEILRKQREQELAKLKETIKDLQNQLRELQRSDKIDLKTGSTSGKTNVKTTTTPVKKSSPVTQVSR